MRTPASSALLWLGAAIAAGGAVLLGMHAWVNLPIAVVILLAKALPFVVGGSLMAFGAVLGRRGRRALPHERAGVEVGAGGGPRAIGRVPDE